MESHGSALPALLALLVAAALTACGTPPAVGSASRTPSPSPSPSASASATHSASATPTATPGPPLSLATPKKHDRRRVRFTVTADVPGSGTGRLTIRVSNLTTSRIRELVLRWPTALSKSIYLAPFQPSTGRLTSLLIQPWTKWVIGPGEMGEPAGTTSLGWGPLLPDAQLEIPLYATRRASGAVAFDLQVLAGEAILSTPAGGIAETRVTIR